MIAQRAQHNICNHGLHVESLHRVETSCPPFGPFSSAAGLLLVEDDASTAHSLIDLLEQAEFHVIWVDRLEHALDHLKGAEISEVLLDLDLPDSSGLSTLARVRETGQSIPVVVLTGMNDPEMALEALRAGADDYLAKGMVNGDTIVRVLHYARERRAASDVLRTTEERYGRMIRAIQEGIWQLDRDDRTVFVNEPIAKLLDYSVDDLLGKRADEFLDGRATEELHGLIEMRRRGITSRHDLQVVRKDGRTIWVSVLGTPLFDADGNYDGLLATIIDITSEKEHEAATLASDERFRVLVEQSVAGVHILNGTTIEYVNPEMARILGRSQSELIGRNILDFVDERDRSNSASRIAARQTGRVENVRASTRFIRGDGEIGHAEIVSTLTTISGRSVLIGTAIDVTDRVRGEVYQRHLASIVEATEDAIFACDTDGNVMTWNPAAESMFGYTRAEIVGSSLAAIFRVADLPQFEIILKAMRANQPVQLERELCRKDGTAIKIDLSVAPLRDASRAVIGASIVGRDVTRKRAAERQREQDARLAGLGRTAAAIAHEFNNVLMSILPFAQIIERRSGEPKVSAAAQQIRASVSRGKSITEEILRFAKPATPRLQPTDLGEFLHRIEAELSGVLGNDVDFRVEVPHANTVAMLDSDQMTQVLVNLAINAKHAMAPRNARLLMRATPSETADSFWFGDILEPEHYVHLQIDDNGCGMDGAALDRIFEPFYTTKPSGTGLGLAIVRQIIVAHSGRIFVESEPASGTSFHIFLPKP